MPSFIEAFARSKGRAFGSSVKESVAGVEVALREKAADAFDGVRESLIRSGKGDSSFSRRVERSEASNGEALEDAKENKAWGTLDRLWNELEADVEAIGAGAEVAGEAAGSIDPDLVVRGVGSAANAAARVAQISAEATATAAQVGTKVFGGVAKGFSNLFSHAGEVSLPEAEAKSPTPRRKKLSEMSKEEQDAEIVAWKRQHEADRVSGKTAREERKRAAAAVARAERAAQRVQERDYERAQAKLNEVKDDIVDKGMKKKLGFSSKQSEALDAVKVIGGHRVDEAKAGLKNLFSRHKEEDQKEPDVEAPEPVRSKKPFQMPWKKQNG